MSDTKPADRMDPSGNLGQLLNLIDSGRVDFSDPIVRKNTQELVDSLTALLEKEDQKESKKGNKKGNKKGKRAVPPNEGS